MTEPRYRGRFGLPALTTPEAVVVWLVLTLALVGALLGIGEVFDLRIPQWLATAAIWFPPAVVALTPKKRKRERTGS